MSNHKVESWTSIAFDKMRKEKTIMPATLEKILTLPEFQDSGVTEEELRHSVKERFVAEREEIIKKMKEKLRKLKDKGSN